MINFVVLKESLNFGFLSHKIGNSTKYTIINQPTCIDINIKENDVYYQFWKITINFHDYIKNDDYNPVGLIISISTNEIYSDDYING
jgi:hypothetical protein